MKWGKYIIAKYHFIEYYLNTFKFILSNSDIFPFILKTIVMQMFFIVKGVDAIAKI